MVLEFLLRNAARTGSQQALDLVAGTCEAMARGGMYDQLSGGFARYSVDRFWRVPHFEKMLYDNALLLRVYLHWWRQTGSPLAERVARETGRFLLDELRTPEGGFASALDADSDGHEGTFYVWNPNQLMRVLGVADGAWAAQLLGVTGPGTFERGFSTLQLREDPDDAARWAGRTRELLGARAERTRPARDDKVVASWNGLAITALAEAGVLLDEPDFDGCGGGRGRAARSTCTWPSGSRARPATASPGANAAVLEDHGAVAEAFIAVLGVTGDAVWLDRARVLLDRVVDQFTDPDGRLLRHRRRRRGPRRTPEGRVGQRVPVRHVGGRRRAAVVRGGHRRAPLSRRRRVRHRRRPRTSRRRCRGSRGGRSRPPRRWWPVPRGRGRRPAPTSAVSCTVPRLG